MRKLKLPHDLRGWLHSKGCTEDADGNWYPPGLPQKKLSLLGLAASFWFGWVFTFGLAIISNVALAWALNYFVGVPWPWTVAVVTALIMLGIWRSERQRKELENLRPSSLPRETLSREELIASSLKLGEPGFRPFGGDLPASPDFVQSTKNWIRAEINRMDMADEDMSSSEATEEGLRYAIRTGQSDRCLEALKRIEDHVKLHGDDPNPIQEDLTFIAEIVARARLERPLALETVSPAHGKGEGSEEDKQTADDAAGRCFDKARCPKTDDWCPADLQLETRNIRPSRILLAEDEPLMASIMADLLREQDYDVIQASTVPDAIEAFRHNSIDVAIFGVEFEGDPNDGFDLLKELQSVEPKVVAILVTALRDARQRALHAGFHEYLCKPFRNDDFLSIVQAAAHESRSRKQVSVSS